MWPFCLGMIWSRILEQWIEPFLCLFFKILFLIGACSSSKTELLVCTTLICHSSQSVLLKLLFLQYRVKESPAIPHITLWIRSSLDDSLTSSWVFCCTSLSLVAFPLYYLLFFLATLVQNLSRMTMYSLSGIHCLREVFSIFCWIFFLLSRHHACSSTEFSEVAIKCSCCSKCVSKVAAVTLFSSIFAQNNFVCYTFSFSLSLCRCRDGGRLGTRDRASHDFWRCANHPDLGYRPRNESTGSHCISSTATPVINIVKQNFALTCIPFSGLKFVHNINNIFCVLKALYVISSFFFQLFNRLACIVTPHTHMAERGCLRQMAVVRLELSDQSSYHSSYHALHL